MKLCTHSFYRFYVIGVILRAIRPEGGQGFQYYYQVALKLN